MKIQAVVLLTITSFVTAQSWTIDAWKQSGCLPREPDYPKAVLELDKCHTFTKDHRNAAHSIAVHTTSGPISPVKWVAELFASSDCTDTKAETMHKAVDLWASGCISTTPDILSAKLTIYPGVWHSTFPIPESEKKHARREKGRTV